MGAAGDDHPVTEDIERLLDCRVIAVIGISPDPGRDSHMVAAYLQRHGYQVVPVNPAVGEVLGEKAYPSLSAVPFQVDAADVFRRPEHLVGIVEEAIAGGLVGVWGQYDVVDEGAARRARAAGLVVVTDHCWKVEHSLRRG